jgi:hypothetical protein
MSDLALPAPARVHAETFARSRRQSASFGDLVHARWQSKMAPTDDSAREHYEATRERFEAEQGKIVDDYWSAREPAGIAICCQRLRWGREQWSLHRITGSLAAGHPEFSRLLLHGGREAVRAGNVLRGMTQRVAVMNLFSLNRDIMAALEGGHGHPAGVKAYARDLHDVGRYVGEAGARQAQIVYLKGVMRGLLALVALAPLLALALSAVAVPGVDGTLFVGCVIAGSFGAAMSVLNRMSGGRFDISHEVGRAYVTNREYVTNLGLARPFIGATFALLLYFAFQGELLQQVHVPPSPSGEFAFFIASGFLIGFSERFAKEIVRTAEPGAGGRRAPQT